MSLWTGTIKNMSGWDKEKHGVDKDRAKAVQSGVNKPAGEVLRESWQNLKDAFTPGARANVQKENKQGQGGYPKR